MIRRPPRSTLFPSPPLFRFVVEDALDALEVPDVSAVADRSPLPEILRVVPDRLIGGGPIPPAVLVDLLDRADPATADLCGRSEEHTSELQSQSNLVCRLLLG